MDVQGAEIERGEVVYKLCSGVDYSLDLDVDVVAVAVSVTCVRCLSTGCGGCLQAFESWTVYSVP
jgi:hypothetical protein